MFTKEKSLQASPRRLILKYYSQSFATSLVLDCYNVTSFSLLSLLPPLRRRVSPIIQPPLDHLDPTLVDHLSPYLNTCPIRHLLWLSVSCGCQSSTVQGSSPHKCSMKSSYSAFNVVVAVFPQIFFGISFSLTCFWGTSFSLMHLGRLP